jgi:cytochrome c-type biogenesis protein CcmH
MRPAIRLLVILIALLSPLAALSAEPDEILKDPALEARARALSAGLRCLVCQNQSIDDSNAPLARDLRLIVRERLVAGDTDAQVRDFVVARYGTYVLLSPPLSATTILLWSAPALLLVFALGFIWTRSRRGPYSKDTAPALTPEEEQRLSELLAEKQPGAGVPP